MSAAADTKVHEPAEPEEGIKITVVPDNALSAAGEIKQAQEKGEKAAQAYLTTMTPVTKPAAAEAPVASEPEMKSFLKGSLDTDIKDGAASNVALGAVDGAAPAVAKKAGEDAGEGEVKVETPVDKAAADAEVAAWLGGNKNKKSEAEAPAKTYGMAQVPLKNINNQQYTGEVYFGNPPQKMTMQFDTGSAIVYLLTDMCTFDCNKQTKFKVAKKNPKQSLA